MRTTVANQRPTNPWGTTTVQGVTALVDVLAARCRVALLAIEAQGGPDLEVHLAILRRALSRSSGRTHRDRDHIQRTLATIATGAAPGGGASGWRTDDRRLVADLRHLERVLTTAARVGRSRDATAPRVSITGAACPRADG